MKTNKTLISISITSLFFVTLVSFVKSPKNDLVYTQQKKWIAPASADKIINPLKADPKAAASGKKLYVAMCFVCHGPKGKGDGIGGAGLKPKPTDLSSVGVQSQSDGAIFWKIAEGRAPMAGYKNSIPEKKRWEIINYLRTLKQ